MAIVVGGIVFTAWELAALAAATITAAYLSSPSGQAHTREAIDGIANALDDLALPSTSTGERVEPIDIAIPRVCEECTQDDGCPPCIPSVGTTFFEIHRCPPSAPHYPCPDDHVHFYEQHQNPINCRCFLKRNSKPVLCLSSGEEFTPSPEIQPL